MCSWLMANGSLLMAQDPEENLSLMKHITHNSARSSNPIGYRYGEL